jgi:hypothetical protein
MRTGWIIVALAAVLIVATVAWWGIAGSSDPDTDDPGGPETRAPLVLRT